MEQYVTIFPKRTGIRPIPKSVRKILMSRRSVNLTTLFSWAGNQVVAQLKPGKIHILSPVMA